MLAYSAFSEIFRKTLQIARETQSNNYFSAPQSKNCEGCIRDQNFSKYEHETVAIYGTGEFEVYNNENYINTFDSENVINISMVGKIFVLQMLKIMLLQKFQGL